jgi:hypothetical protein
MRQKKGKGEEDIFFETDASIIAKLQEDLCVLLIAEGKHNSKVARFHDSNRDF